MAGIAPNTTTKIPAPQRSLSRRVSFNEATISKHQTFSDDGSDAEAQPGSRPRKGCASICNSCCAWTAFIAGILFLLVLLVGGVYFSFLQSNMPEVHLRRLDVYALNVTTDTDNETFLTSNFEVTLNVTNKDSRIHISYSPMTATIMSEGINLGTTRLPALQQGPQTSSDVKVHTTVNRIPVEEAAGSELSRKSGIQLMVITVNVGGHVDFSVNGNRMIGFPFKITCTNIDQSVIDEGRAPACSAKMSPLY